MATDEARGTAGLPDARAIEEQITKGEYREALSLCAEAYAVPLSRFCMAFTGSQAESEALTQETLLAAYGAFAQYRGDGSLKAWIFGIARRTCGRHVELRSRQSGGQSAASSGGSGSSGAQAKRAREALSKLKPSEREAMVLRYEAGLSIRELSIAIGVDETQARKRVSRALARLGSEMGKE
jgi:RNA polymerase sigma-70 factor (ECF subfamily)